MAYPVGDVNKSQYETRTLPPKSARRANKIVSWDGSGLHRQLYYNRTASMDIGNLHRRVFIMLEIRFQTLNVSHRRC